MTSKFLTTTDGDAMIDKNGGRLIVRSGFFLIECTNNNKMYDNINERTISIGTLISFVYSTTTDGDRMIGRKWGRTRARNSGRLITSDWCWMTTGDRLITHDRFTTKDRDTTLISRVGERRIDSDGNWLLHSDGNWMTARDRMISNDWPTTIDGDAKIDRERVWEPKMETDW